MIYKICSRALWLQALQTGEFAGAAIDLQDGYIHFSSPDQVQETAAKHFCGQQNLVLLAVEETSLGDRLKWEVSRNGALFPHLYRPLNVAEVAAVYELPLAPDSTHQFPACVDQRKCGAD